MKMRKILGLLAVCCVCLILPATKPASAASIFIQSSGTVSSDVTYSLPSVPFTFPLVFGQNLAGQTVFISQTFNLDKADFVYTGQTSWVGSVGNSQFASAEITIGNVSASLKGAFGVPFGTFTLTPGGFSSEVGSTAGLVTDGQAILDYSSTFTQNGTIANASLRLGAPLGSGFGRTLDFNVTSETFAVSAVPLPPTLPLFALALLALGIVGYMRRAKDVAVAQT
jgi:hypothetical protein